MSDLHIPEIPHDTPSPKKRLIFFTKLGLTVGALALVIGQADLDKILIYAKEINLFYALLGLIALNIGQMASGLRMRHYFAAAGLRLSVAFAVALYYVGMLFNLILPGGIGGDGYKAYYLKKKRGFSWKTSLRCIISGRGNGLLLLILYTLLACFFSQNVLEFDYAIPLLILAVIGLFPSYYILARYMLKESLMTQIIAGFYSAIAQGSVVVTVVLLLHALGHAFQTIDYVILFMISSIVSILPISIGGVGLREATFFYAAPLLALDAELGVTLSLLYFMINTLASMFGAIAFLYIDRIKK